MEDLDIGSLGFLETSDSLLTQLQDALKEAGFGFDEFRKAQALYWLALSPYGEEPDFVEKLVGCFAPDQTNEELIANVNAAFGTDIDPEEFEKILATTASDMVAVAQSQIGHTSWRRWRTTPPVIRSHTSSSRAGRRSARFGIVPRPPCRWQ